MAGIYNRGIDESEKYKYNDEIERGREESSAKILSFFKKKILKKKKRERMLWVFHFSVMACKFLVFRWAEGIRSVFSKVRG